MGYSQRAARAEGTAEFPLGCKLGPVYRNIGLGPDFRRPERILFLVAAPGGAAAGLVAAAGGFGRLHPLHPLYHLVRTCTG